MSQQCFVQITRYRHEQRKEYLSRGTNVSHSQASKLTETKLLNCAVWLSQMRNDLLWFEIKGMNHVLKTQTHTISSWPSIIDNKMFLDYSFHIDLLVPQNFQKQTQNTSR